MMIEITREQARAYCTCVGGNRWIDPANIDIAYPHEAFYKTRPEVDI